MTWTTPRTWVAGETVTAAMLNAQVRDNLNVISPLGDITQLTQYTPVLTATTTNPTLGTAGTISGAYSRIGGQVAGTFTLVFGTTPSSGSGSYLVTVPAAANSQQPLGTVIGAARALDASASTYTTYTAELFSTTQMVFRVGNNNNVNWGSTSPAAPAVNDTMSGNYIYGAA